MPPIINGNHSKITLNTKNVFIECTATDLTKAKTVLDTIVCLFSSYCAVPFETEYCEIITPTGKSVKYPELPYRTELISTDKVNNYVGIQ